MSRLLVYCKNKYIYGVALYTDVLDLQQYRMHSAADRRKGITGYKKY